MKKVVWGVLVLGIFGVLGGLGILNKNLLQETAKNVEVVQTQVVEASPTPTIVPSPTLTPTPTPIPLPDPKVYGPCRELPVLMYHHVQTSEEALAKGQKSLTVNSDVFSKQMEYLSTRGYTTLTPDQLLSGLSVGLPSKSVVLTFDDGYADFYIYVYPELSKRGFVATMFLSTGLVGNPDYLTWGQIGEIAGSKLVNFGNHTWSHKGLGKATDEQIRYELETAQTQLTEHGLGPVTSFAYPYGTENARADVVLRELGIKTAFTTVPGNYQCAKLPYDFRRIRIGNSPLSVYGL